MNAIFNEEIETGITTNKGKIKRTVLELKTLVLAEGLNFDPSTYTGHLTASCNSSLRCSCTFF